MNSKGSFINTMLLALVVMIGLGCLMPTQAWSQADQKVQSYVNDLEQSKAGMTLWETIQSGGVVMIVLGCLSVVAFTIILYLFFTLKMSRAVPREFTERVIEQLDAGQEAELKETCEGKSNTIANIVNAGLARKQRGKLFAKEAMENQMRKEIGGLWQGISYLADIAAVAPLIGLLGTVVGMIQAFNVIAFQSAVVKPILLAGGVSKAMVTTAAGLVVAIPVMLFYTYFRGKVQGISHQIETYGTDIIKIFEESGE